MMKIVAAALVAYFFSGTIGALAQPAERFGRDGSFVRKRLAAPVAGRKSNGMDWDLFTEDKAHKSPGDDLFNDAPGSRLQGPRKLQDGSILNVGADGSKTFIRPDGSQQILRPDGSRMKSSPDGSVFEQWKDGSKTIRYADGKETVINPDGTGVFRDGSKITKNAVDNSTLLSRPDGLGLETKADGTQIFKRSNGLETVRTTDGRIYMRDSKTGQPVGREIKK